MSRLSTTLVMVALTLFACKSSEKGDESGGATAKPAATAAATTPPPAGDANATTDEGAKTPEKPTADATAAPPPEGTELAAYQGAYELKLDPDAGWHRNELKIDTINAANAKGSVVIDWNLGPEKRAPGPDDIAHTATFEAPIKDNTLEFTAKIGKIGPVDYVFKLHLCPASKNATCDVAITNPHLVGTVKKGPEELKAKATRAKTP